MNLIEIEGQPASARIRADLAAAGEPVLLAFSRGKDSIAAWLALRDAGVPVVPYHLYLIPELRFVAESLAYFEDFFGQHILNVPHPSLFRWLNFNTFQPPERLAIIEAAQLPNVTYDDIAGMLREDIGNLKAWVADGVRAADSPTRRLSMATHGPVKEAARKVSVVWDWRKSHVTEAMTTAGVEWPPEYQWFGRSFDGVDARFLLPLREHAPDDYQRVLDWLPLADLEAFHAEHCGIDIHDSPA